MVMMDSKEKERTNEGKTSPFAILAKSWCDDIQTPMQIERCVRVLETMEQSSGYMHIVHHSHLHTRTRAQTVPMSLWQCRTIHHRHHRRPILIRNKKVFFLWSVGLMVLVQLRNTQYEYVREWLVDRIVRVLEANSNRNCERQKKQQQHKI